MKNLVMTGSMGDGIACVTRTGYIMGICCPQIALFADDFATGRVGSGILCPNYGPGRGGLTQTKESLEISARFIISIECIPGLA